MNKARRIYIYIFTGLIVAAVLFTGVTHYANSRYALNLQGYVDKSGAISILYQGDTVDPYFVLQALLLARANGLDISAYSEKWANWLIARQKPDATFDRFCKTGPVWSPCKTADADDAILALWLTFLDTMPKKLNETAAWQKSYQASEEALMRLHDQAWGVYFVSPVYQHGLLMDNLEVWSYLDQHPGITKKAAANHLEDDIYRVFLEPHQKIFLVSTQTEQKLMPPKFYPDYVAQIFPLLLNFKKLPFDIDDYYQQWMHQNRTLWLEQVQHDFAWGLIALIALDQHDKTSASCWLGHALPFRSSSHWTLVDEVAYQVLWSRRIVPTQLNELC